MVKPRSKSRGHEEDSNQGLILGALACGLIGVGAALFLSSKKGKCLREDIADTYDNLSDKAYELKNSLFGHRETFMDKVHNWVTPEEHSHTNLVIGSVAGGLLGATAIYFACKQSGVSCQDLIHKAQILIPKDLRRKSERWLNKTKDTLEKVSSAIHQFEDELEDPSESRESPLHGVVELANLGYRLFNTIKGRR